MRYLLKTTACAAVLLISPWSHAQDANLARNLAATCANCHGTDGKAIGAMPALAGMQADKIITLLAEYKSGKRPATIMHQISRGYTEEQIALIANYLARQKP